MNTAIAPLVEELHRCGVERDRLRDELARVRRERDSALAERDAILVKLVEARNTIAFLETRAVQFARSATDALARIDEIPPPRPTREQLHAVEAERDEAVRRAKAAETRAEKAVADLADVELFPLLFALDPTPVRVGDVWALEITSFETQAGAESYAERLRAEVRLAMERRPVATSPDWREPHRGDDVIVDRACCDYLITAVVAGRNEEHHE